MDAQNPRRHDPYRKLAGVHRGKPVCRFIRADCAQEIEARVAIQKVFRALVDRWVELFVEADQASIFNAPRPAPSRQGLNPLPGRYPRPKRSGLRHAPNDQGTTMDLR